MPYSDPEKQKAAQRAKMREYRALEKMRAAGQLDDVEQGGGRPTLAALGAVKPVKPRFVPVTAYGNRSIKLRTLDDILNAYESAVEMVTSSPLVEPTAAASVVVKAATAAYNVLSGAELEREIKEVRELYAQIDPDGVVEITDESSET